MYRLIKNILYRLVSKQQLLKHELFFRNIYSIFYSGSNHQCPVCDKRLNRFIRVFRDDLMCPKCGSLARDRRLWMLLENRFLKSKMTVLDFSPSRSLARKMKSLKDIDYISTDLSGNFIADNQYDITNIEISDESIDLVVCYHILEHIDNDAKAMQELYRVIKRQGKALIQTPFKEGDIYEDFSIIAPTERELHFGQDDHVRIYSVNGLKTRLEKAGFTVDAENFKGDFYSGLAENEIVFIITKM